MPDRVFEQVELRTARLVLRAASPADRDGQVEAGRDEQTQRWLPLPRPYTAADADAFTLHEIMLHVIVDLQRHAGHADIVREQIDGSTGLLQHAGNLPVDTDWPAYVAELTELAERSTDG